MSVPPAGVMRWARHIASSSGHSATTIGWLGAAARDRGVRVCPRFPATANPSSAAARKLLDWLETTVTSVLLPSNVMSRRIEPGTPSSLDHGIQAGVYWGST